VSENVIYPDISGNDPEGQDGASFVLSPEAALDKIRERRDSLRESTPDVNEFQLVMNALRQLRQEGTITDDMLEPMGATLIAWPDDIPF
jgi:hypothetical protein